MKCIYMVNIICIWIVCMLHSVLADDFSWETVLHESKQHNYTKKLEKDAHKFVKEVEDWTYDILDSKKEILPLNYHFYVENEKLAASEKPCGDLILHKIVSVLKKLMKDPASAKYSIYSAHQLTWHPSFKCMQKHHYLELDGGAGAGFEVLCGNQTLMKAGGGGGSQLKHHGNWDWQMSFLGGSSLGLNIFNGKIEIEGGILGTWQASIKKLSLGKHPKQILKILRHKMQQCATNHTLLIKGGGGGGWNEKYTEKKKIEEDKVGYGFRFELGYKEKSSQMKSEVKETMKPTIASTVEPTLATTAKPTIASTVEPTLATTAKPTIASTVEPTNPSLLPVTNQPTPDISQHDGNDDSGSDSGSDDDANGSDQIDQDDSSDIDNYSLLSQQEIINQVHHTTNLFPVSSTSWEAFISKTKSIYDHLKEEASKIAQQYSHAMKQCKESNDDTCIASTSERILNEKEWFYPIQTQYLMEKKFQSSNHTLMFGILCLFTIGTIISAYIVRTIRRRRGYEALPTFDERF